MAAYSDELTMVATFSFPCWCHDWVDGSSSSSTERTNFGDALRTVFHLIDVNFPPKELRVAYPVEVECLRSFTLGPLSSDEMQAQWKAYHSLLLHRAPILSRLIESKGEHCLVRDVGNANQMVWGSKRQYAFAKCVVKILHAAGLTEQELDPVWGVILRPSGGIVGPGNRSLYRGNMNRAINVHCCVHDAFGYVFRYHARGPGYNYLSTWVTVWPTESPWSCQFVGVSRALATLVWNGTYAFSCGVLLADLRAMFARDDPEAACEPLRRGGGNRARAENVGRATVSAAPVLLASTTGAHETKTATERHLDAMIVSDGSP
eukprot:TRINITY_DN47033_c0_g1_i1.p1 TRINITY_DN47033_c0_g1~~TRINITY_DN47033_c0_g1_i1.p1  ORF type:complete len:319 (+),score=31.04 TRINITY_DN47033_c0_g1_i1:67-1023(+)